MQACNGRVVFFGIFGTRVLVYTPACFSRTPELGITTARNAGGPVFFSHNSLQGSITLHGSMSLLGFMDPWIAGMGCVCTMRLCSNGIKMAHAVITRRFRTFFFFPYFVRHFNWLRLTISSQELNFFVPWGSRRYSDNLGYTEYAFSFGSFFSVTF